MPPKGVKNNFAALLANSDSDSDSDNDSSSVASSESVKSIINIAENVAWADMDTSDEEGNWEATKKKTSAAKPAAATASAGLKLQDEIIWDDEIIEESAFEVVKKKGSTETPVPKQVKVAAPEEPKTAKKTSTIAPGKKMGFMAFASDSSSSESSDDSESEAEVKPTKASSKAAASKAAAAAPKAPERPTPAPKKKVKEEKEDFNKVISEFQEADGLKKKKKKKVAVVEEAPKETAPEAVPKAALNEAAPKAKADPKTKLAGKIDDLFETPAAALPEGTSQSSSKKTKKKK